MTMCRQRRQEIRDVRGPQLRGVTLVVEHDEAPDPDDVRRFGPPARATQTNGFTNLIEPERAVLPPCDDEGIVIDVLASLRDSLRDRFTRP